MQARDEGIVQQARSLMCLSIMAITAIVWGPIAALVAPFVNYDRRYGMIKAWLKLQNQVLRLGAGLHFTVSGLENLPKGPAVVLSKHQSLYETFMTPLFLPPQAWVLKQELLRIPFFGWGLATLKPIHIDRLSPQQSLREIQRQGAQRLAQGIWVVIYPEGTRVRPGEQVKYAKSGAMLAARAGVPVVPLAHNAGQHWLRGKLLIRPGTVHFRIGPTIATDKLSVNEVNEAARQWIEQTTRELEQADSAEVNNFV
jgi:1-acyl-sn-glycerol-3-phosphate acyltransferase